MKLNFEMLPSAAWNCNLRTVLSKKGWDFIRKDAYSRAGGRCSVCNAETNRLEAHEVWEFDKAEKKQILKDVIAVCHACHSVIHIGRTQLAGFEDKAIKHFEKVNKTDFQGYISALKEANEKCAELSRVDEWSLDLTWLKRYIPDDE